MKMERKKGFEPSTLALARRCSTAELLPPITSIWWLRPESNWRHADFQSAALPTELPSHIPFKMAELTGIEPAIFGLTGRRVKPLHYSSASAPIWWFGFQWWAMTGSNCRPPACKAGALPAELIARVTKLIIASLPWQVNIYTAFAMRV